MSENQLTTKENRTSIFSSIQSFEDGQRIAKGLASLDLVPAVYKIIYLTR